jgi:hypothetical protein
MAFRASNEVATQAYVEVKRQAVHLKQTLNGMILRMSSESIDYDYLAMLYNTLEAANVRFDALKGTPGLSAHAKTQENDPAYDVAAEFAAMQTAITNAQAWIVNNVPLNVALVSPAQWTNGVKIDALFTSAQTAPLRTVLQTVTASIQ